MNLESAQNLGCEGEVVAQYGEPRHVVPDDCAAAVRQQVDEYEEQQERCGALDECGEQSFRKISVERFHTRSTRHSATNPAAPSTRLGIHAMANVAGRDTRRSGVNVSLST